jgi:hypothetical protein
MSDGLSKFVLPITSKMMGMENSRTTKMESGAKKIV